MIDPGTPAPSWSGARLKYLTSVAEQPLHRALGLTDGELDRIRELLGREPNHFELAVFSLLWSEHCAYKHSARLLRRLPTSSPHVLQGPGENAGVVDLGEGEAVAFKVESHNHPSAVEPFQGAATGIGGVPPGARPPGARPPGPPLRGRALPGRGDRNRRDPPRRRRHGRAPRGAPRRAALRRA